MPPSPAMGERPLTEYRREATRTRSRSEVHAWLSSTATACDQQDGPELLRVRRTELGLSASHVAAGLGVHPTTVLRWERGERSPGSEAVVGLARALRTDIAAVSAVVHPVRPEPAPGLCATGLRSVRTDAGVRAVEVAAALGVRPSTVYNWEHGRARLPDHLLGPLAQLLGHEPDGLRALLRRPGTPRALQAPPRRGLQPARVRCGLTQRGLAARVGVSRHLIGRWERGAAPDLYHLRRLAIALDHDVAAVARWFDIRPPSGLDPRHRHSRDSAGATVVSTLGRAASASARPRAAPEFPIDLDDTALADVVA